jgi:Transcriptional regulators containing a DNA-binding HTH domain and an aminotransferase domain (MocR family) and their eukaryotic orthologs
VTYDLWADAERALAAGDGGRARYQKLASFVQEAVRSGLLRPGDRLPTVRELASRLGVSITTVVSAYSALREDGVVQGEVGRGTFVRGAEPAARSDAPITLAASGAPATWRRRALANAEDRLTRAYPRAVDLMRGSSNSAYLPLGPLKKAWTSVARELTVDDVQYPVSPAPEPELVAQLLPRFETDGIPVEEGDLLVGSSTIQFLSIVTELLRRDRPNDWPLTVAVEEPGYQAGMDVLERFGCGLIGMAIDEHGVLPDHLRAALDAGAGLVVLTPRAANPTGTTWSAERLAEIADIVASHPDVLVVEDDYFADAAASTPGSLLADQRVAHRVVHVRGFAKAIAPDLRLAAAVVRSTLHSSLAQVQYLTTGWTSRTTQRVLARVLAAGETADLLERAKKVFAERRDVAEELLAEGLRAAGGSVQHAHDGLYTWISLPPGSDASIVAELVAQEGFLVAPGEPFFIRPGAGRFLRLNSGSATADEISAAARAIIRAATGADARSVSRLTP